MSIDSATTALNILNNGAFGARQPADSLPQLVQAETPIRTTDRAEAPASPELSGAAELAEIRAKIDQLNAHREGQRNGTISPFEDSGTGLKLAYPEGSDPLLVNGGTFVFSQAASEGGEIVIADAALPDRRAAVANAYSFATWLLDGNQEILRLDGVNAAREGRIASWREQLSEEGADVARLEQRIANAEAGEGGLDPLYAKAQLQADRAAASLGRMFSFTDTGLEVGADGSRQLAGFTVTHGVYGKIMEVSDSGEITMFDASGKAYDRAEYIAAEPDGAIPRIELDLKREAFEALPLEDRIDYRLGGLKVDVRI